jgi:hypothetical protein
LGAGAVHHYVGACGHLVERGGDRVALPFECRPAGCLRLHHQRRQAGAAQQLGEDEADRPTAGDDDLLGSARHHVAIGVDRGGTGVDQRGGLDRVEAGRQLDRLAGSDAHPLGEPAPGGLHAGERPQVRAEALEPVSAELADATADEQGRCDPPAEPGLIAGRAGRDHRADRLVAEHERQ